MVENYTYRVQYNTWSGSECKSEKWKYGMPVIWWRRKRVILWKERRSYETEPENRLHHNLLTFKWKKEKSDRKGESLASDDLWERKESLFTILWYDYRLKIQEISFSEFKINRILILILRLNSVYLFICNYILSSENSIIKSINLNEGQFVFWSLLRAMIGLTKN